jgi:hypothetical protein
VHFVEDLPGNPHHVIATDISLDNVSNALHGSNDEAIANFRKAVYARSGSPSVVFHNASGDVLADEAPLVWCSGPPCVREQAGYGFGYDLSHKNYITSLKYGISDADAVITAVSLALTGSTLQLHDGER